MNVLFEFRYLGIEVFVIVYVVCFMFKIYGGIIYKDIERNVFYVEMLVFKNEQINRNVDIVLFFDEVNISEVLGMIKEIMVD